jgi:hypothetical protein
MKIELKLSDREVMAGLVERVTYTTPPIVPLGDLLGVDYVTSM